MSLNRKEAINLIEKIRAYGVTNEELIDMIFTNILPSHVANQLAIDLAEEFDAWRSKQPDMQDHNSVYRLTNAVHDRQRVYLLSHIYDGSYQSWDTPAKSEARIITLEEWRTITHPHAAQQPQTISRQSLETIYNAACIDWKNKIVTDIVADKPLAKDYEISPWYVAEMFKASSAEQKAVLIAAGLKDPTEKLSPYAKITSCGDV